MRRSVLVSLAALAIVVAGPGVARGEAGVAMKDSRYTPRDLTVAAGETVVWTNDDGVGHSVTADDGSFDSSPACGGIGGTCMGRGATFRFTFKSPGRVSYHCRAHGAAGGQGMAGTVTVTG